MTIDDNIDFLNEAKKFYEKVNKMSNHGIIVCKVFGHQWRIKQRSNVIQYDDMGYPLRLFICECKYCMKSELMWRIDNTECKNDVVIQWSDDAYIPIPPKSRK